MAVNNDEASLSDLKRMFQQDRLIKVYIAQNTTPYMIAESTLRTISNWFVRALDNKPFFGGEDGTLKFPEDNERAWEILLFWKIHAQLPCLKDDLESNATDFVHCWSLGDKCNIPVFQDLAMLELMALVVDNDYFMPLSAVKLAFEITSSSSLLCLYLVREVAYSFHMGRCCETGLELFESSPGFISEFTRAVTFRGRRRDIDSLRTQFHNSGWKEFMIEKGPFRDFHWIWRFYCCPEDH